MTNARTWLAEQITPKLPENYSVLKSPQNLPPLPPQLHAAIVIERTKVQPAPSGTGSHYREDHRLWVVVQGDGATDKNEDDLDDALDRMLEVIAGLDGIVFTSADRAKYNEQQPCYAIDITLGTSRD